MQEVCYFSAFKAFTSLTPKGDSFTFAFFSLLIGHSLKLFSSHNNLTIQIKHTLVLHNHQSMYHGMCFDNFRSNFARIHYYNYDYS